MTCPACANPSGGLLIAGCRDCTLRDIAKSPGFAASVRHNRLRDDYKAALRALGDVAAVHEEVKAVAKALFVGATRA